MNIYIYFIKSTATSSTKVSLFFQVKRMAFSPDSTFITDSDSYIKTIKNDIIASSNFVLVNDVLNCKYSTFPKG